MHEQRKQTHMHTYTLDRDCNNSKIKRTFIVSSCKGSNRLSMQTNIFARYTFFRYAYTHTHNNVNSMDVVLQYVFVSSQNYSRRRRRTFLLIKQRTSVYMNKTAHS